MSCANESRYRINGTRQLFLLTICTAFPAAAQFSSMVTDYAGQRLLFTARLSQANSGQPDYGKLFIADSRGVQPLLIYDYIVERNTGLYPGQSGILTNFYYVEGVDIASSGAYISVAAARDCAGYTSGLCGSADQSVLYDASGEVALIAAGRIRVSRNGKWTLDVDTPLYSAVTNFVLHDMTTGAIYPVPVSGATNNRDWRLHDVADDGTAVIATEKYLDVYRPQAVVRQIGSDWNGHLGTGIRSAVINAAGTLIVWEQSDDSGRSILHTVQTADLEKTVDLGVDGWSDSQPRLTDEGSTILFLSTPTSARDLPQVFLMAIDGTGRRRVTAELEGIAQAVFSGNGRVVWALTRTGRLLKIDVDTGARTQYTDPLAAFLVPLNPFGGLSVLASNLPYTPGEVISIPASVTPGETVEVTVQDQTAAVVSVEAQKIVFQIPWRASTKPSIDSANQFQVSAQISIRKPGSPSWSGDRASVFLEALRPTLLSSVHQDFSALISVQQPAHPGEIIHFFGSGFGPVSPPVPDGAPAPIEPLSRTVNAVTCDVLDRMGADTGPADVLFAGLAPGMIGIYQLDVRLPDPLPVGNSTQIACYVGDGQTRTLLPVSP